ncbi:LLM class flavin-dependent oxidoreductase [Humidisolicoccus flavus]
MSDQIDFPFPVSVLDLAINDQGTSFRDTFAASVELARAAERSGFTRLWYAEHHNMKDIASSATSVLIEHVASKTESIRIGAGGIMLPNHSPLVIAEQFGTLATLHPGRIDLGLGRAPGGDQVMLQALGRSYEDAEAFPRDVQRLQAYLAGRSIVPNVQSYPIPEQPVEFFILGSSLFGASLAAQLGLPFAFASHFAPQQLHNASRLYRSEFTPNEQGSKPHLIVAANVFAAESEDLAKQRYQAVLRSRTKRFLRPGTNYSDDELDALLETPGAASIKEMMRYSAVGDESIVRAWLDELVRETSADELMLGFQGRSTNERLESLERTAVALRSVTPELG